MSGTCVCSSYSDQFVQWTLGVLAALPYGIAVFVETATTTIFGPAYHWSHVVVTLLLLVAPVAFFIKKLLSGRLLGIVRRSSLAARVRKEKRKYFKRNLLAHFEVLKLWSSTPSRELWWLFIALFFLAFCKR